LSNRWILFTLAFLSLGTLVVAQSTLESIKKGEEGDKSWAVLNFSEKAEWLGISQMTENRTSLYFGAIAGDLEGSMTSLSTRFKREISVYQVSQEPFILKVDILHEKNAPLSVLKKNGHLVVAINDERLMEGTLTTKGLRSTLPGRLVNVGTVENDQKLVTTFHFDGDYSLMGYLRPSNEAAALIIQGAIISLQKNIYDFDDSDLKTIRFVEDGSSVKAVLFFDKFASFSIAQRPQRLMIQMDHEKKAEGEVVRQTENVLPESEKTEVAYDSVGKLAVGQGEVITLPGQSEQTDKSQLEKNVPEKDFDSDTLGSSGRSLEKREIDSGISSLPYPGQMASSDKQADDGIPWNQKFDFKFSSTPLKEVLSIIATANDLNMVVVDAKDSVLITMNLKDVTLRQAMEKILYTNNYEYFIEDGIITVQSLNSVHKGGVVTRVWHLRYADAENVAKIVKQAVSNDSLVQVFYPEFLQFGEAGKNRKASNQVAIQGIRRSSTLVVRDRPEKIREIARIISDLDRPPVQFIIHSKLVETAPVNTNQLGINWDKTITAALWSTNIDVAAGMEEISAINTSPGRGGDLLLGHLTASKFQAVLDFLQQKTNSTLKSNPSLMAMDNEESSMSVGTTVPVPVIRRGIGGQGDMVTFDYKEVNIQLNVMPHLAENGEITMYVNPVIEEITDWVEYEDHKAPITAKRSVNSIVSVKHGETVVIGGLIKTQKVQTQQKVWLLGSIPLIGKLFQHQKIEDKQTDLMIFITPTIVRQDSQ
jgi:hypothetical protein